MISVLQKIVSDPKNTFLLFDETQSTLFLNTALPLIQSGISVGAISSTIVKSLGLTIKKTSIDGVFTSKHEVSKPSILCFSSGTKNNQRGIVRSFESWQNSFALISAEISSFQDAKGIVMGALPSLLRGEASQVRALARHQAKSFTRVARPPL